MTASTAYGRTAEFVGRRVQGAVSAALLLLIFQSTACGDDADAAPANTGQTCTAASQCYPGVAADALAGDAVCLDKVPDGYCTHKCTKDSECCSAAGECPGHHSEVCSPFESTSDLYCFLSCEAEDLAGTNITDANQYCQTYGSAAFTCRSTGGGNQNRKVCAP